MDFSDLLGFLFVTDPSRNPDRNPDGFVFCFIPSVYSFQVDILARSNDFWRASGFAVVFFGSF